MFFKRFLPLLVVMTVGCFGEEKPPPPAVPPPYLPRDLRLDERIPQRAHFEMEFGDVWIGGVKADTTRATHFGIVVHRMTSDTLCAAVLMTDDFHQKSRKVEQVLEDAYSVFTSRDFFALVPDVPYHFEISIYRGIAVPADATPLWFMRGTLTTNGIILK